MFFQRIFHKITTFLKEVRLEAKKVSWPTKKEITRYTLIVIGISAVVAMYLGGLDFLFTKILEKFIL